MKQVQLTLICTTGHYKPISTIMDVESIKDYNEHQKEYKQKALIRICTKRYWNNDDLKRYGYTQWKARIYDKEKIEKENAERYAQIKKEKGWD